MGYLNPNDFPAMSEAEVEAAIAANLKAAVDDLLRESIWPEILFEDIFDDDIIYM